uniref:TetR/AcrR family transcriptional regulator n=1 Tax=Eubacterium cellulosolvens TaxID=29322 RepID=UPI000487EDE0|nr:TetR/AcrR family transcriptional regulator [[Eubacterium] cellulosolvens]
MKKEKGTLTEIQKKEVLRMNNRESNQLTRECLQLSLMHLMSEHPYEKITVSEIVRRAGVSRTAFYRNYTEKEDILHELGNKLIKSIAELSEKTELYENPHQWFEDVFRTIREDKETIALFDQAGILQRELFSGKSISELLYPTTDTEIKYIRLASEAAFFQILISWFRDGMHESEKHMADICEYFFENTLKKLT